MLDTFHWIVLFMLSGLFFYVDTLNTKASLIGGFSFKLAVDLQPRTSNFLLQFIVATETFSGSVIF